MGERGREESGKSNKFILISFALARFVQFVHQTYMHICLTSLSLTDGTSNIFASNQSIDSVAEQTIFELILDFKIDGSASEDIASEHRFRCLARARVCVYVWVAAIERKYN